MKFMVRAGLAVVLCCMFMLQATAACLIPAYSATYNLYHGGHAVGATSDVMSAPGSGRYQMRSTSNVKMLIFKAHIYTQSVGRTSAQGFVPEIFTAHDTHSSTPTTHHMQRDEYDALSYVQQLRLMLMRGQRNMTLQIYMDKKLVKLNFQASQKVQYMQVMGKRTLTRLVSSKLENGDVLQLWFAVNMNYVLVQSTTLSPAGASLYLLQLQSYKPQRSCVWQK